MPLRAKSHLLRLMIGRRLHPWRSGLDHALHRRPLPGVNLIGQHNRESGLGQAARAVGDALALAGVPWQPVESKPSEDEGHRAPTPFDTTLLCSTAEETWRLAVTLPTAYFSRRYVIGQWYWELPDIPPAWRPRFRLLNEFWAPTRFILEGMARHAPVPVHLMPPVVTVERAPAMRREALGLPPRRFLFLTACDASSFLERKNPLGAVTAYRLAFPAPREDAMLVVKLHRAETGGEAVEALRRAAAGRDDILLLETTLSRGAMTALLAAADCVVSLHRSEGFGQIPAEGMLLGKPAILTHWSGNVDYMRPGNSFPVGYRMVPVGRDVGPYRAEQSWADPDLAEAAAVMRRLLDEPGLGPVIGRRGQRTIREEFSPEVIGQRMAARLTEIRRGRPLTPARAAPSPGHPAD